MALASRWLIFTKLDGRGIFAPLAVAIGATNVLRTKSQISRTDIDFDARETQWP